jgi:predicted ester cyclase
MTRVDLERLIERYLATANRHDPHSLAALYSANCRVESPLFASLQGRAAVETSYQQFFAVFPDIEFKRESSVIDPPTMAVTTLNGATHQGEIFGLAPTHKRIEFRLVWLVTVGEDGLIAAERRVYDFTGLLVQLGVLRAKPARA